MSFVTKRERVFSDYDPYDLPSRNEGKLKAYASCTDTRAWSHFGSDQTEHLVDIIKRNNDKCAPKYVPTEVIVDTLLKSKKTEIVRLKRKIDTLEQMLAAYDDLDLDCTQRCDIAKAHEAIKAANKELDDMCLDLDLSGFTEGVESEDYQTGKSGGDMSPPTTPKAESKSVQKSLADECKCDVSTSATDPRIGDMEDEIINKDAKLNAMKNTIAAMESEVCEPYCVYAHIYTALEKIFGILYQNDKYKQYLDLLSAGKDTRCIDIKGKILFKMKVLEKFCLALVAPCSQQMSSANNDCPCFRAEVISRVESTFALTPAEQPICMDNKRAQLVADIMENDEMKEILSKESCDKLEDAPTEDTPVIDSYGIESENLNRLKDLQANYEDLMGCYENLKHERDCLQIRCRKYNDLEIELENMREQLRAYNLLWNEKEHFRKRSEDLDDLRENFMVLRDETASLETQLKAESEINLRKSKTIDELRKESIALDKKLNDAAIRFEKEKSALEFKLKEAESKIEGQDFHVNNLSVQLEKLPGTSIDNTPNAIELLNEIETWKDKVNSLRESLFCNEEEKRQLQDQFQDKLSLINDLRMEIEDWKSTCDAMLNRNNYLTQELTNIEEENKMLVVNLEEKGQAVNNLMDVITSMSVEMNKVLEDIEIKKKENMNLQDQLGRLQSAHSDKLTSLESEKKSVSEMLQLERQHSSELLQKVKQFDETIHENEDRNKSLESIIQNLEPLKEAYNNLKSENSGLKEKLADQEELNRRLKDEMATLRDKHSNAERDICSLKDVNTNIEYSLNIARKDSQILRDKLADFDVLTQELNDIKREYNILLQDKINLQNNLEEKNTDLEKCIKVIQKNEEDSKKLVEKVQENEQLKEEMAQLDDSYKKAIDEKYTLKQLLLNKTNDLDNVLKALTEAKNDKDKLLGVVEEIPVLHKNISELEVAYDDLMKQYNELKILCGDKENEMNLLKNTLVNNANKIKSLETELNTSLLQRKSSLDDMQAIIQYKTEMEEKLKCKEKENLDLMDKLQKYTDLEKELDKLRIAYDQIITESNNLAQENKTQKSQLKICEQTNNELNEKVENLLKYSENMEEALIKTRSQNSTGYSPDAEYENLKKMFDEMKEEKIVCQTKIRNLLDKIDENEHMISNLTENLLARDDRVAIMQNHINELENEILLLHRELETGIESSEDIVGNSQEAFEASLKRIDAHHSKATHNMKLELSKMQKERDQLSSTISAQKQRDDEIIRENQKYMVQLAKISNDMECVTEHVRQLEIKAVGNSELRPQNNECENVIASIQRIDQEWDTIVNINLGLQNTLCKAQSSSQLLLTKTDEAKKLAEKEKEKILSEKEDALNDKLELERRILGLNKQLESQMTQDKSKILDLEAEIKNQNLLLDKLNKLSQENISKLEEEMSNLQARYEESIAKNRDLELNLLDLQDAKKKISSLLDKTRRNLDEKCNEVAVLRKEILYIKSGLKDTVADPLEHKQHQEAFSKVDQSDDKTEPQPEMINDKFYDAVVCQNDSKDVHKPNNETKHIKPSETTTKDMKQIQVLTATTEPSFDFVKNTYLLYKIKRLSPGPLEQHSISEIDIRNNIDNYESSTKSENLLNSVDNENVQFRNEIIPEVKNIYNRGTKQNFRSTDDKIMDQLKKQPDIISSKDEKNMESSDQFTSGGTSNTKLLAFNKGANQVLLTDKTSSEQSSIPKSGISNPTVTFDDTQGSHVESKQSGDLELHDRQKKNNSISGKLIPKTIVTQKNKEKVSLTVPANNEMDRDSEGIARETYLETSEDTKNSKRLGNIPNIITSYEHIGKQSNREKKQGKYNPKEILLLRSQDVDNLSTTLSSNQTSLNYQRNNETGTLKEIDETKPKQANTSITVETDLGKPHSRKENLVTISEDFLPQKDQVNSISSTDVTESKDMLLIFRDNPNEKLIRTELNQNAAGYIDINPPPPSTSKNNPYVEHRANKAKHITYYDNNLNTAKISGREIKSYSPSKTNNEDFFYLNTHSDIKLYDKSNTNKGSSSLPSISTSIHYSQPSLSDLASGEETNVIRKMLEDSKALRNSDTDDEKLKQMETARLSHSLLPNFKDAYYHQYSKSDDTESHHKLDRTEGDVFLFDTSKESLRHADNQDYALEYIMESVKRENPKTAYDFYDTVRKSYSDLNIQGKIPLAVTNDRISSMKYDSTATFDKPKINRGMPNKKYESKGVMVKNDATEFYEQKIDTLTNTLDNIDKDYKLKLETIKKQYDANIKNMINEHNLGVRSMQNLHEDTLQDIIKIHENEVENLRTMSIEAMRKAEKLENENKKLKHKITDHLGDSLAEHVEVEQDVNPTAAQDVPRRGRSRDSAKLTKTIVDAFNVKPKSRSNGPCTCSIDTNVSDTIRNIFEHVDVEQRKMAESVYIKYIANKMVDGNVEVLDSQELAFLHYNVCRIWKMKLSKEEALQKKITTLESELMNKQRHAQKHIAELDRKLAEERRRLEEVREAVCQNSAVAATGSHVTSPQYQWLNTVANPQDKGLGCHCKVNKPTCNLERKSAGDLLVDEKTNNCRSKKGKQDVTRATTTGAAGRQAAADARRDKRLLSDELPTRLRRDRAPSARAPRK